MKKLLPEKSWWLMPLLLLCQTAMYGQHDIGLTSRISGTTVTKGSNVTFTVVVKNEGRTNLTGVKIQNTIPDSASFISSNTNGVGTYNSGTHEWDIGAIASTIDTLVLTVTVRVTGDGVIYHKAEVLAMTETDIDSAPSNASVVEDDYTSACVSVPMLFCSGSNINIAMSAPAGYTNYKFFKNGASVQDGASNVYTISSIGSYTYETVTATGCAATLCCPVTVDTMPLPMIRATNATICQGLNVNLSALVEDINPNTALGGWGYFATLRDAQDSTNVLTSSTVTPNTTTIYYIRRSYGSCYTTASVTVTVNPLPTAGNITATSATCSGAYTPNSDATIDLTGFTDGTKVSYGTNGVVGFSFATATAMTNGALTISGLPNPGAAVTYTLRIYSADATCYIDRTVIVNPTNCPCATPDLVLSGSRGFTSTDSVNLATTGFVDNASVVGVITYHSSLTDAVNGTNPITNTTRVGTTGQYWIRKTATQGVGTCYDTVSVFVTISVPNDLSISKQASVSTSTIGSEVDFTITVKNDGQTNVTGVQVTDAIPVGTVWVSDNSAGSYNPVTGIWNIGSIAAATNQVSLTIHLRITGDGVIFNQAEITAMDGTDTDSSPNNHSVTEDDIAAACISVPMLFCANAPINVTLTAPAGYGTYRWLKDGNEVQNTTANTYVATQVGSYTYETTIPQMSCPAGTCCPLVVATLPQPTVQTTDTSICNGGSKYLLTLVRDGNAVTANGSWSFFPSLQDAKDSTNRLSATVIPLVTTEYFVRRSFGTCYATGSLTVTVHPRPNAGADAPLPCNAGVSNSTYNFNQAGLWNVIAQPNGATASVTNAGVASGMTVVGNYDFEFTDGNGCKDDVRLTVGTCPCPMPDLAWAVGHSGAIAPKCMPQVVDISIPTHIDTHNVVGTVTYHKTEADALSGANALLVGEYTQIAVSGTYWLRKQATNGTGSCFDTLKINVVINPTPVFTATNLTVCEGAVVNLNNQVSNLADATGLKTWRNTDANGNILPSPTTLTISTSGTYYFEGTTTEGCSDTATMMVTMNPLPVMGAVTAIVATCSGIQVPNNDAKIDLTGFTNGTKVAYGTNGVVGLDFATATTMTNGALSIAGLSNPLAATTYTLRIYSADATCYKDTTVVLNPKTCSCTTPDLVLTGGRGFTAPISVDLATTGYVDNANVVGTITYHANAADAVSGLNPVSNTATTTGQYWIRKTATQGTGACYDTVSVFVTVRVPHDLAISKSASVSTSTIGSQVAFTIIVKNQGLTNVTGVQVKDTIPAGTVWVSDNSAGAYSPVTGIWNIGNISAATAEVRLTINLRITGDGVISNTAEITAMDGTDTDSSPNNQNATEDDIAAACISVPMLFCSGDAINVTLTAPAGYANYRWLKNGVAVQNSAANTYIATAIGQYTFETNTPQLSCPAGMCCPIMLDTLPRPNIQALDVAICAGDSKDIATLATETNGATVTGTWSFHTTWSDATTGANAIASTTVTPLATTKYYVRRSYGVCYDTDSMMVTVNPKPDLGADFTLACNAGVATTAHHFNQNGTWTIVTQPAGATATVSNSGAVTNMTVVGNYDVAFANANGCNDTIRISAAACACPMPDLAWTGATGGSATAVCAPQSVDISVLTFADNNNVIGTITYHNVEADALTGANPLASTQVSTTGTYWIRKQATHGTGSCFDTMQINVVINPKPVFANASLTVCEGTFFNLNTQIANRAIATGSNVWKNTDANGSVIGTPTNVMASLSSTYYFEGTTTEGCVGNATVTVTVNPKPNLGADFTLACNVGVATTAHHFNQNGTWAIVTQPAGATATVSNSGAVTNMRVVGNYDVEFADANGCKDTIRLIAPPCVCPMPDLVLTGANGGQPNAVCYPQTIDLTTITFNDNNNVNGETTYHATANDAVTGANPLTLANTQIASSGTYWIRKHTLNGAATCYDTLSVNVVINPKPIFGDGVQTICENTLVNLTNLVSGFGAANTTRWMTGSYNGTEINNAAAIYPALPGLTYYFVGTTALGCKDSAIITINVNPKPELGATRIQACNGGLPDSTFNFNINGTWAIIAQPANGRATVNNNSGFVQQLTVAGDYDIEITNIHGCKDTVRINVPNCACASPDLVVTNIPAPVCAPDFIDLTQVTFNDNQNINGTIAYFATANDAVNNTNPLTNTKVYTTATYWIRKTSNVGSGLCYDTVSVTIVINPKPDFADTRRTVCEGEALNLTALISNNNLATGSRGWYLNTFSGTRVPNELLAYPTVPITGYYFIGATAAGCIDSAIVTVTVNPKPNLGDDNIFNCHEGVVDTDYDFEENGLWRVLSQPINATTNVTPAGFVSGLSLIGNYTFEYINSNTCKDTVQITIPYCPCSPCELVLANQPAPICAPDSVNLATVGIIDNKNIAGVTTYHTTASDASLGLNPMTSTKVGATGTYWVRKQSLNGEGICYDTIRVEVTVHSKPNVGLDSLLVCNAQGIAPNTHPYNVTGTWNILAQPVLATATISNSGLVENMQRAGLYDFEYIDLNQCKDTVRITIPNCVNPCDCPSRQDLVAPTIQNIPQNVTVTCPRPQPATVTATDNCTAAQDIVITLRETVTDSTHVQRYMLTRVWTATDACGNTATASQIVIVKDTSAPIFDGVLANAVSTCTLPAIPTLTASDNCGADVTITYAQVVSDSVNAFKYTVTRIWTATDENGNARTMSQVVRLNDSIPPIFASVPTNLTVECAAPALQNPTATDNCGANVILVSSASKMDSTCANNYKLVRTWTATDAAGNTAVVSQTITVMDTTRPMLVGVPQDITLNCGATLPLAPTVTATDACDNNPRVTMSDQTIVGNCAGSTTIKRTWTATDACGNRTTAVQLINIGDFRAPLFGSVPANVTVNCDNIPSVLNPTVSDNCDQQPTLTYSQSRTDGNCLNNYTLTRTWVATDACNNVSTTQQTIVVQDTTRPMFVGIPANVTVACNAIPAAPSVTATDNCGVAQVAMTQVANADSTLLTRTWTATDSCGNVTINTQFVTIDRAACLLSIQGVAWIDKNGDGVQEGTESRRPLMSVVLTGTDQFGSPVNRTVTTDANGTYRFEGLNAGTYRVQFVLVSTEFVTYPNLGSDATDSDIQTTGFSDNITLTNASVTVDAGLYNPATIGDLVWADTSRNGLKEAGESGLPNVLVTLLGTLPDGSRITLVDTTDANGLYLFENLRPGVYQIDVELLHGYEFSPRGANVNGTDDSNIDPQTGVTQLITLTSGEVNKTIDAGLLPPIAPLKARIGYLVWEDKNGNGIVDPNEPGIGDVLVTLTGTDSTGAAVTIQVRTEPTGHYAFDDLLRGTYTLTFTAPNGMTFTVPNQGTDDVLDSDVNANGIVSVPVRSGESNFTVHAGLYTPAKLGDLVWMDDSRNGLQAAGEAGVPNVTVNLTGTTGSGTAVTLTTTTDANGLYLFANLHPGQYQVSFVKPLGFDFTTQGNNPTGTDDSNVNTQTGLSQTVTLASGDDNRTIDAGLVRPIALSSLGNKVWEDTDGDGIQDANEVGLSRVIVILTGTDANGNLITLRDTTDANGLYSFDNLLPGSYKITYLKPTGYEGTYPNQGNNLALNSDADPITGQTQTIVLTAGQNETGYDAGFYRPAKLGDLVWMDNSRNGLQTAGEVGVANVVVTLTGTTGNGTAVSLTTTTDANGSYLFEELRPGQYQVAFTKPLGLEFTTQGNNPTGTDDSNVDTQTGLSQTVTLVSGDDNRTIDAGLVRPILLSSVGNKVWEDKNGDGTQDLTENGIANVIVLLDGTDAAGNIVTLRDTTDANGLYLFDNLLSGTYHITYLKPTGYEYTFYQQGTDSTSNSDANPWMGNTPDFVLGEGVNDRSYDAGFYRPAMIGDLVWADTSRNGLKEAGERGLPNVLVTLYGTLADGTDVTLVDTTDANGFYLFENLRPGVYQVDVELLHGYEFSPQGTNVNGTDDSNINPQTGSTPMITVVSGEPNLTIDAGLLPPIAPLKARIGYLVWEDKNGNGIVDPNEPGIGNVLVTLTGTDITGTPVNRTVMTEVTGHYAFNDLLAGTYSLTFTAPNGMTFTYSNQGNDDNIDSDVNPNGVVSNIVVQSGESNFTVHAGLYTPAKLGDLVWLDNSRNGVQNAGEAGVPNVTVNLTGTTGNGTAVTLTTTTDANGLYLFDTLRPGQYQVSFVKPLGLEFTTQGNNPAATDDSNVNRLTGVSAQVILISGSDNRTIDAGLIRPLALSSIGNRVWEDTDGDGIQDANELGLSRVIVLLTGTDINGNPVTLRDTTDANGLYRFDNLLSGTYKVTVEKPTNYVLTYANQGNNVALNSDFDPITCQTSTITLIEGQTEVDYDAGLYRPAKLGDLVWMDDSRNGLQAAGETGVANVIVTLTGVTGNRTPVNLRDTTDANGFYLFEGLHPGQYRVSFAKPTGLEFTVQGNNPTATDDSNVDTQTGIAQQVTLLSGDDNRTIDAGLIRPLVLSSIGNKVWEDTNGDGIQDANELGISSVIVLLTGTDVNGNPVTLRDTTDANGLYRFDGLMAGSYKITYLKPVGYEFTYPDQGTDATVNSDANPATGQTATIVLVEGQHETGLDAGFYRPAQIGDLAWVDDSRNGLKDLTELGLANVIVTLTGITGNGTAVSLTATTDANGSYLFDNLRPGRYGITFSKPTGYSFTTQSNNPTGDNDSNVDVNTGQTATIVLVSGTNNRTIDVGYTLPIRMSVGNLVWNDNNNNGKKDGSEVGIPGVKVTLMSLGNDGLSLTNDDIIIDSLYTNANGNYLFTNVLAGDYYVMLSNVPTGIKSSTGNGPTDTGNTGSYEPSNIGDVNDEDHGAMLNGRVYSQIVHLAANQLPTNDGDADNNTNLTIDFGLYVPQVIQTLSLGNSVWNDVNNNGIKDANESGLPNVRLGLYTLGNDGLSNTADDVQVTITTSSANGNYLFTNLNAGTYFIKVLGGVPTGMFSSTGDGATDTDGVGAYEPANVGDQNDRDHGTDLNTITFSENIELTVNGEPTNDGDNDANTNLTVDFGFYAPQLPQRLTLGNLVWNDANNNGINEASELGLADVKLVLCTVGNDGRKGTADDVVVDSTVTNANGYYLFTNVSAGSYYVKVKSGLPQGMVSSTGDGSSDMDGQGAYEPSTVGDADGRDHGSRNPEGITSGLIDLTVGGEPVNDGDTDANTNLTVDLGFYRPVPPSLNIGNLVWHDANNNGKRDVGEAGIEDIEILLCSAGIDGVIGTADDRRIDSLLTDANGGYLFTNVAEGNYFVKVKFGVPLGMRSSTGNGIYDRTGVGAYEPGINSTNNDEDHGTQTGGGLEAISGVFHLAPNTQPITDGDNNPHTNLTLDFGFYVPQALPTLTLGNSVWNDANNNGIKDSGESGIANVVVQLFRPGLDGVIGTADDITMMRDTTDATGTYSFEGLSANDYYVKLIAGIPTGMRSSTGNGITDTLYTGAYEPGVNTDLNNRDHGTRTGTTISSGIVTLTIGGEPTNDGDNNANTNLTIDFGLYKPQVLNPILKLGNLVWFDENNNGKKEATEEGIPGVEVILYKVGADGLRGTTDDVEVGRQLTNLTGNYLFSALTPGDYFIKLNNGLQTLVSSTGDGRYDIDGAGLYEPSNIGKINNQDHGTQQGNTIVSQVITLTQNGEPTNDGDSNSNTNLTADFGLYKLVPNGVFDLALIDRLGDNEDIYAAEGDTVKFTMMVLNQGTRDAYNVKVKGYLPNTMKYFPHMNTIALANNANNWANDTTCVIPSVRAGDSVKIHMWIVAAPLVINKMMVHKAEIMFATDQPNGLVNTQDVDSRADNNVNNDVIGGDNVINNRNNDEDDHDYAGVVAIRNFDPLGHIYCDKTKKIVKGGTINVTGPGLVFIQHDGHDGFYQWWTDGTPGLYTMTYSHPDGYPMSTLHLPAGNFLDPTGLDGSPSDRDGLVDSLYTLGSRGNADETYLADTAFASNPYYMKFELETGDPFVNFNNIPVQCGLIGTLVFVDLNNNNTLNNTDLLLDNVKVDLFECGNAVDVLSSGRTQNGRWNFDGLVANQYMIRFTAPTGYEIVTANVGGNELTDSDADPVNGFTTCIPLVYGQCDTIHARLGLRATSCATPIVEARTGNLSTCTQGGVQNVSIRINQPITSYTITGSAGYRNVVVSGQTIRFEAILNGNFNNIGVTMTTPGGCTITDNFTYELANVPLANFTVLEPFCRGEQVKIIFTGRATAGAQLNYSLDGGRIIRRSAGTATRPLGDTTVVIWDEFGGKVVRLDVNDGGCTDSKTVSILIKKALRTDVIKKDTTICPNTCVVLKTTAANSNIICLHNWRTIQGDSTGLNATYIPEPTACVAQTTIYILNVLDVNSCSSNDTVIVRVKDTTVNNVRFVGVPRDTTIYCGATLPIASVVTAIDTVLRTTRSVTMTEQRVNRNCGYDLVRTWSVQDSCVRAVVKSQTISVRDTQRPIFQRVPNPVMVTCGMPFPASAVPTAIDSCSEVTIGILRSDTLSGCTIKRTWVATDACGNSTTVGQIIILSDTVKPVIRLVHPLLSGLRNGDTMSMDCGSMRIFNAEDAVATDNCSQTTMEFVDLNRRFGTCATDGYTILMECAWKATDACGNVSFFNFFVKMTDHQAPVLSNNIPRDTAINLLQGQRIPAVPNNISATDNCTDNVQVTFAETQTPTATGYILNRVWTATDACGNAATGGQRITVLTGCTLPTARVETTASNCGEANGTVTLAVDNIANYRFVWSAGIAGATNNSRIGLTPGQYSVRVQRLSDTACMQLVNFTIANDATGCCSSFVAATAVVRTLDDCAMNPNSKAEVCVEIASNQIAAYTILDNGRPYNGGFGVCGASSSLRFNAGDHTVIFTRPDGCKDTLSVTVHCVQDFQVERNVITLQNGTWCPSELGLSQTFVSIENQCPTSSGTNARFTLNPVTRCVTYTGLTQGIDTACLYLRSTDGRDVRVRLLVNTTVCYQNIIPQDTIPAASTCVGDSVKACFDIPLDSMANFVVSVDGYPYTSRFEGCKFDTMYTYTYFTVPGRGNSGPYRVDSWMVNGRSYSGVVANVNVLVDSMNRWDRGGNWRLNSGAFTLVGGNHNNNYGTMRITKINNGAFALLNLNRNLIPKATMMWVKTGRHTLSFVDTRTGCMDTAVVLGACVNPTTIIRTINVGQSETFCLERTELMGRRYISRAISSIPLANVNFNLNPITHCVTFTGLANGNQNAAFIICDEFGICDTTYFYITVRTGLRVPALRPNAKDDTATTTMGRPVVIYVLNNDSTYTNANTAPSTVTILLPPQHGTATVNNWGQILFVPDANYCGATADRMMYVVCNGRGCDTAMVRITVQCPSIRVNNGFSPNGDGFNDTFVIEGLENYPSHKIQVFNRWGTEVYQAVQYKSSWEGNWDTTNLPEGTYFYIIDLGDGSKPKSGYVQIQR